MHSSNPELSEITDLVVYYKETGRGLRELKQAVALLVYRFPIQSGNMDPDLGGDLLLYVYPRIEDIISRFRYTGTPFEAYLRVVLRHQMRGLYSEKRIHRRRELLLFIDGIGEYEATMDRYRTMEVCDRFWASYRPYMLEATTAVLEKMFAAERRLVMFVLKVCLYIRPDQLAAIAELLELQTLQLDCALMREQMEYCLDRIERLKYYCNRCHLRILAIEYAIASAILESERVYLRTRLVSQQRAARRARKLYEDAPRTPANRDIAQHLGLPKGTVDSGLFYLRRQLWAAIRKS